MTKSRPMRPEELELLTQPQREAQIYYDLGWGYRSIATHLGISMSAVRDRLEAGARRVARYIDEQEADQ